MAKILVKRNKWQESQRYFKILLKKLATSKFPHSNGFLIECHYGLAKCAYHLGDNVTAIQECNIALKLSGTQVIFEGDDLELGWEVVDAKTGSMIKAASLLVKGGEW